MLGTSQLQFVAQIKAPRRGLRRVELGAARALIGGPELWASVKVFYNLQTHFRFPVALKAFDVLAQSAMIRTGLHTIPGWRQNLKILEDRASDGESQLVHPFPEWLEQCAVFRLRDARRGIDLELFNGPDNMCASPGVDPAWDLQHRIYELLLPTMHRSI